MLKKHSFWIGIAVGIAVGFLYGWLSIWATYTSLERADRERTEELEAIKRIIYFSEDIQSQHKESVDWNEQNMISMPEWAVEPKEE